MLYYWCLDENIRRLKIIYELFLINWWKPNIVDEIMRRWNVVFYFIFALTYNKESINKNILLCTKMNLSKQFILTHFSVRTSFDFKKCSKNSLNDFKVALVNVYVQWRPFVHRHSVRRKLIRLQLSVLLSASQMKIAWCSGYCEGSTGFECC